MLWILVFLGLLQICSAELAVRPDVPYNITELEQRVEILEVEVANIEDDINDVETDVNQQDDRITVVEAGTFENTNDIADLSSTMVILLERVTLLEASNNLQQEEIDSMQTTINEQSVTISALEETVAEQSETIAELEETIEVLQSIDNSTVLRLDTVEGDIQALDTELNTLAETMAVLEDTVDDVEDAMTSIEAQNQDLHGRLTAVEEIVIVPWVACASSPCSNGGSCIDVNVDTFICMCRDGYYGDTCQYTPTEACASSPCTNGGTCIDVNVETFTCLCRDGFFGETCEQSFIDTSFLATFDVSTLTPTNPLVFNVARLNPGGHYDVTTGIYTVPLDGIYQFVFHVCGYSDSQFRVNLVVDGTQISRSHGREAYYSEPTAYADVIIELTAGQQVWVYPGNLISMWGAENTYMFSWFSAHLVYAM